MAPPAPVEPVKFFVAVLRSQDVPWETAATAVTSEWGEFDFVGPDRPFDATDYYQPEMGAGLLRRLVSFAPLYPPEDIRGAKLRSNALEDALAGDGGRRVNLDIGYLDHNKIVLASLKAAGQKIHLGDGVYADLVARWRQGRYQPFEWTFPDFRDGRYDEELGRIRNLCLQQRKARAM
jgi:hypothetical protein